MESNETIKSNVLKLQNANASSEDIDAYVKSATQEMSKRIETQPQRSLGDSILESPISQGIQSLFPGKKVGEAIGTLGGYIASPNKEQFDTSAPSPLQVAGDVALGALTTTGVGGKFIGTGGKLIEAGLKAKGISPYISGLAGRSVQSAIQGAYFGGAKSLSEGDTLGETVRNIGGTAAVSALFPGITDATAAIVGYLVDSLPRSMIRGVLRQTNKALEKGKDVSDQFLEDGRIGTYNSLLKTSNSNIESLGKKVSDGINSEAFKNKMISRNSWVDSIVSEINSSGGSISKKELLSMITSDVQGGAGLLSKSKLTLPELDTLRKRIGDSLGDSAWLASKSPFSTKILKNVYSTISESVKKNGPAETRGLFDDLTKEITIRNALRSREASTSKSSFVTMKDLLAALGGFGISGGSSLGALTGLGAIKAGESTLGQTLGAQALYKTGNVLKSLSSPGTRNLTKTAAQLGASNRFLTE